VAEEQFPPPVVPSELPGSDYPVLTEFLRRQVDMQFADLRLLLRLPVPELEPHVGCNLTAASMMLNVISGFSRWFYRTERAAKIMEKETKKGHALSAERFKGFVEEYWPQEATGPSAAEVAKRLYEVRNSLAHDLGARDPERPGEAQHITLSKGAMSLDDVVTGLERGLGYPFTVPVIEVEGTTRTVHLAVVYWALHRMLRRAIDEKAEQIEAAVAAVFVPEIIEVTD